MNQSKQFNSFLKETDLNKNYSRIKMVYDKSTKYEKSSIIESPNYKNAVIPIEKFTKYALDSTKDSNKATAFEKALGYNLNNYQKLIDNIKNNINKFNGIEKGDNGYGVQYEVLMRLIG